MNYNQAFSSRNDLFQYKDNALILFALELKYAIEDIHSVAAEAITDGGDDKKCDVIYINQDRGVAVIAQGYISKKDKASAPANKASDLNTAASWLLNRENSELPERLQPAAQQLWDAIDQGKINSIEFWFVHNLPSSANVKSELTTVSLSASNCLRGLKTDATINVIGLEVGQEQIEEWFSTYNSTILIQDEFNFNVPSGSGYLIEQDDWTSFSTFISIEWLSEIFYKYKQNLFSANVRGYLGSRKSSGNINNGIKETADQEPKNFWVYNNGLTILVNELQHFPEKEELHIQGISIVNGAQTTGALGSLATVNKNAFVQIRFVKCHKKDVVNKIIKYNNSQNQVEAPDFRSGDAFQKRLREEFKSIPQSYYSGGRRGGHEDKIKRPPGLLPSDTVGQALAAFHGDPVTAYNEKSKIWISDAIYSKYFTDRTTALHIVFAYSLLRAIEHKKLQLIEKDKSPGLSEEEKPQLKFFRSRGSTLLLLYAISRSIEIILSENIHDKFLLKFKHNASPNDHIENWKQIIEVCIAFAYRLNDAIIDGLKNLDSAKKPWRTSSLL